MKNFIFSAALLFLSACAGQELTLLRDRNLIEDTIVAFAVRADAKDWKGVQNLFTPVVRFTMSGGPETMRDIPREEMTGLWEKALRDIPVVHHQVGNIQIQVDGNNAHAKYYGVSLQYKPKTKGGDIRGFVGAYQIGLLKMDGKWQIRELLYTNKFVGGNLGLQ